MRVAICTKNDLFGAIVLNHVLPALPGHDLGVFMSVRDRTALDDAIPELDLMRMLERLLPLDILFPLLDGAPPVPGRFLTPNQATARAGCRLTLVHDMAPGSGLDSIEAFAPDLILSVRFSYLFKRSTIAMARSGIINVHPGPLPQYRGLYAPFWQMLGGNQLLSATVHLVDPGVDTGPVLSIESVALDATRSLFWHATQLYLAGAARAVEFIRHGLPPAIPQDPAQAAKFVFPQPQDFARFRDAGFSLVRGHDYRNLLDPFVASPRGTQP